MLVYCIIWISKLKYQTMLYSYYSYDKFCLLLQEMHFYIPVVLNVNCLFIFVAFIGNINSEFLHKKN